jgi:phenylpropionate dioxygenase-like ring-hydroxylating dioxygenase large terminal subunit
MLTRTEKPWPQNAWYQAAWSHEVKDAPLARTFLNEPVVLFRDSGGKARALEDRCCHRATPLRLGEVVPEGLQCGYHGMVFDGSGKCVKIPGQDSIPPQAKVRSYPIAERQEFVWIWMGDAALADESKLIDYPWNDDHARWPHLHGMNHVKCNFMLLMDNLMDLTHIPHIHKRTIGGGSAMEQINAQMDVKRTEKGVHYIRWMLGITPPPTYVKAADFGPGVKVDRWQDFEYVAPASVIQWAGALEAGRGAQQNREQPGGFNLRLYHGATPETETSCFYFWTPANGYKPGDEAATQLLFKEIASTFLEDVAILEAQQERMSADPGRVLVDLKNDIARLPARRALERMIREEISQ